MPVNLVLLRGGGDLASGVAVRLYRAGYAVLVTEISRPLAVRRTVAFSEAVYDGETLVEGIRAFRIDRPEGAAAVTAAGGIPVLVDPELQSFKPAVPGLNLHAVVDARLLKRQVPPVDFPVVIGLGPGFIPGQNCAAVVETMRGHTLGRVYRDRPAEADTGLPEGNPARVLRSPVAGIVQPQVEIGDLVAAGDPVAGIRTDESAPAEVLAGVDGVVRGMIRPGIRVKEQVKIGDVDPRGDRSLCFLASDKALAVGGGVLEALLSLGVFPGGQERA